MEGLLNLKNNIFLITVCFFLNLNNLNSQFFDKSKGFIEAPLIYSFENNLKGITKITPIQKNAFSKYTFLELSLSKKNINFPEVWLNSKIYDELDPLIDLEGLLLNRDSPFESPIFERFKNSPMFIKDTIKQISDNPLVYCNNITSMYNKAGIFFELNCAIPLGFFNNYIILRLQYSNNLWYFLKINTLSYKRLNELVAIAETLTIKKYE